MNPEPDTGDVDVPPHVDVAVERTALAAVVHGPLVAAGMLSGTHCTEPDSTCYAVAAAVLTAGWHR